MAKQTIKGRPILFIALLAVAMAVCCPRALAEKRVALIIGNGGYPVDPLKNPPNDARLMASTLKDLGFAVMAYTDLDLAGMNQAIDQFGRNLKGAEVGLFFYAGHGAQYQGHNYLIPVGVDIKKANELPYRAINAGLVLAKMESEENPVNLVFLDACRNNPFARSWRSPKKGLASMPAPPRGTKIFYATRPNRVAKDGDGQNSPFTKSLVRHITRPGLELQKVIRSVVRDVEKDTGKEQSPWPEGVILSDFYFSVEEEERGPGQLEIVLKPEVPGAWVRINGRDYGNQRQFTIQDQGRYRIEIGADGYRTHRKTEVLGPGMKKTVTARLEKVEPAVVPEPEPITPAPSVSDTPAPGDIIEGPLGMEFAWVPAGSFMMGSPPDEPGRDDNEKQHKVRLTRGFWMGTTEVTQGQWKAIMGSNPSYFDECGEDCPVENVSWEDAQDFIKKLNRREGGNRYRLPTEAEWEYAARSGGKAQRYAGGDDIGRLAWYSGNSGGKTHRVGTKAANGLGIHDMSGNVWEWCQDWYGEYPSREVTDPTGPSSGSIRVNRGGGWSGYAGDCRSANRDNGSPGYRISNLGFRLLRTP